MKKIWLLGLLMLCGCKKQKVDGDDNFGAEVATLIDAKAECVAKVDNTAVCRVNGNLLLCSREGCQPIKYTPPSAEVGAPKSGPDTLGPLAGVPDAAISPGL
jgi:hypothetical protein